VCGHVDDVSPYQIAVGDILIQ